MLFPFSRHPYVTAALITLTITSSSGSVLADGPADNNPATVRPIPPPGIEIDAAQADELAQRCIAIRKRWDESIQAITACTGSISKAWANTGPKRMYAPRWSGRSGRAAVD